MGAGRAVQNRCVWCRGAVGQQNVCAGTAVCRTGARGYGAEQVPRGWREVERCVLDLQLAPESDHGLEKRVCSGPRPTLRLRSRYVFEPQILA